MIRTFRTNFIDHIGHIIHNLNNVLQLRPLLSFLKTMKIKAACSVERPSRLSGAPAFVMTAASTPSQNFHQA